MNNKLPENAMYQQILDALNAEKTTRQHINTMKTLYQNSGADPRLQTLIYAFDTRLQEWLDDINKLAKQKTPSGAPNKLSAAKATRAQTYIPSSPPSGATAHPTVTALIAYCQSRI